MFGDLGKQIEEASDESNEFIREHRGRWQCRLERLVDGLTQGEQRIADGRLTGATTVRLAGEGGRRLCGDAGALTTREGAVL